MNVTYPQIKKIFALGRDAGLDSEELHELVTAVTGSESIKGLSKSQGIQVIERLNNILGLSPNRASNKQVWQIYKLAEELGWQENSKRLRGFLEKQHQVSHPKYLKPSQANDVIEALKAIQKREQKGGLCTGKTS